MTTKGTKKPVLIPITDKPAAKRTTRKAIASERIGDVEVKYAVPTKPLTSVQLKYAQERLRVLADDLVKRRIAALPPFPPKPELSFTDKLALIRSGKAKLLPDTALKIYTDLVDAFTYPEHARALASWEKRNKARADKLVQIRDLVNFDKQKLGDELALGVDGASALAKLEAFAKLK